MKRAFLTSSILLCSLAVVPFAHAEEEWFVSGTDPDSLENAALIVVTRPVQNGGLTITGSSHASFPGGTYYPYHLVVLGADGEVAGFSMGWFTHANVRRGAYDLTVSTGDFIVYQPDFLPWEAVGFVSLHVSEP